MGKLRPVKLQEYNSPDGEMRDAGLAKFHCFSTESVIHDMGPEIYCVAVVELPDGTVKTWNADCIIFTDVKPVK